MLTITCPNSGTELTLDPDDTVSTHRTAAGTVTYYRCPCGNLVTSWAGGVTHVRPHTDSGTHECAAAPASVKTLGTYLDALTVLADVRAWTPEVRVLVHDVVTLVAAAARHAGRFTAEAPSLDDPPVVCLRALATISARTGRYDVPLTVEAARTLDKLCNDLNAAIRS